MLIAASTIGLSMISLSRQEVWPIVATARSQLHLVSELHPSNPLSVASSIQRVFYLPSRAQVSVL